MAWTSETAYTGTCRKVTLLFDSDGNPHIIFLHYNGSLSYPARYDKVMHAYKSGGSWAVEDVASFTFSNNHVSTNVTYAAAIQDDTVYVAMMVSYDYGATQTTTASHYITYYSKDVSGAGSWSAGSTYDFQYVTNGVGAHQYEHMEENLLAAVDSGGVFRVLASGHEADFTLPTKHVYQLTSDSWTLSNFYTYTGAGGPYTYLAAERALAVAAGGTYAAGMGGWDADENAQAVRLSAGTVFYTDGAWPSYIVANAACFDGNNAFHVLFNLYDYDGDTYTMYLDDTGTEVAGAYLGDMIYAGGKINLCHSGGGIYFVEVNGTLASEEVLGGAYGGDYVSLGFAGSSPAIAVGDYGSILYCTREVPQATTWLCIF